MKKIIISTLLAMSFIFSGCSVLDGNEFPSVTNSSFTIVINDTYDIVQTSATTSDFVKNRKIHQMEVIVDEVDKLNWNEKYVVLQDYDGEYYIYDMDTEELSTFSNYQDFKDLQDKLSFHLDLKEKNDFDRVE
ncbi:hypothetical protein ABG980_13895 [Enterococcus casseliflavus]|uniref:hypothetical protein n=1 Tax=Enterococcus TaxID=1350 RepID=UPI0022B99EFA|nr:MULTISPECIES: hypothetical protein [Enterococcus]MDB1696751.1 hypothetical protein [Enterococcus casseliflavus]MDB1700276.1 hypothetical protein [Enterococcus casseliflavus]MDB1703348.1 hypothetical protein [Enterococcus casseliflavus]MDB1707105.1 hypothetical protein [Enterococcus casseliflavus]MDT2974924.1 hypothetical protein [Enterococcus casseliflavus]